MEDSDMLYDLVSFRKSKAKDDNPHIESVGGNNSLKGAEEEYSFFVSYLHEKCEELASREKNPHCQTSRKDSKTVAKNEEKHELPGKRLRKQERLGTAVEGDRKQRFKNLRKAVKEEIIDEDDVHESNTVQKNDPRMCKEGEPGPSVRSENFNKNVHNLSEQLFEVVDHERPVVQSDFRKQVTNILREPYSRKEYDELRARVKAEKHLKQFPCLKKELIGHPDDNRKKSNLLRGFFFWLEHKAMEGAFQPWTDAECMAVKQESMFPPAKKVKKEFSFTPPNKKDPLPPPMKKGLKPETPVPPPKKKGIEARKPGSSPQQKGKPGPSAPLDNFNESVFEDANLELPVVQSDFRKHVINIHRKPYNRKEYDELRAKVKAEKHLKQFPCLKKELIGLQDDNQKKSNLLRGFFFWFKHQEMEGAFQPWTDAECLAVKQESMFPPPNKVKEESPSEARKLSSSSREKGIEARNHGSSPQQKRIQARKIDCSSQESVAGSSVPPPKKKGSD